MISPQQAFVAVALIIFGLFIFYTVNVDEADNGLEPGASITVQGATMTVYLIKLDLSEGAVLKGDQSADIKRVEYRINGGDWVGNVINSSMWIPLDAANVTSFEVMGLRGDTLVVYSIYEIQI